MQTPYLRLGMAVIMLLLSSMIGCGNGSASAGKSDIQGRWTGIQTSSLGEGDLSLGILQSGINISGDAQLNLGGHTYAGPFAGTYNPAMKATPFTISIDYNVSYGTTILTGVVTQDGQTLNFEYARTLPNGTRDTGTGTLTKFIPEPSSN